MPNLLSALVMSPPRPPPSPPSSCSFPSWVGCNQLPDDVHPKSLRSMFTYNTNVWAASATAKSRGLMKVWGVGRS